MKVLFIDDEVNQNEAQLNLQRRVRVNIFRKSLTNISISIPNSDTYDVFHKATMKVKNGTLEVRGFIFDAEKESIHCYSPGAWIKAWTWE